GASRLPDVRGSSLHRIAIAPVDHDLAAGLREPRCAGAAQPLAGRADDGLTTGNAQIHGVLQINLRRGNTRAVSFLPWGMAHHDVNQLTRDACQRRRISRRRNPPYRPRAGEGNTASALALRRSAPRRYASHMASSQDLSLRLPTAADVDAAAERLAGVAL